MELCRRVRPRTVVPVHYEGWSHFQESRETIEHDFATAPGEVRRALCWLPLGVGIELDTGIPTDR